MSEENKKEEKFNYFQNTEVESKGKGANNPGAGDTTLYVVGLYILVVLAILWFVFF